MINETPLTRIVNFEQLQESKLPSATRLSRMIDLGGEKPNIPIYVLKKAGERGTKVHEYIHNYFENISRANQGLPDIENLVPFDESSYIDAFDAFASDEGLLIDKKYFGSEVSMISEDFKIKGIIDAMFVVDDDVYVYDWKTSGSFQEYPYTTQMQVYMTMIKAYFLENFGKKVNIHGSVVQLKKNGKYKVFPIEQNTRLIIDMANVFDRLGKYLRKQ